MASLYFPVNKQEMDEHCSLNKVVRYNWNSKGQRSWSCTGSRKKLNCKDNWSSQKKEKALLELVALVVEEVVVRLHWAAG